MTMDDVANAVGIAKASLYKHFASKGTVLRCHGANPGQGAGVSGHGPRRAGAPGQAARPGSLVAGAAHRQRNARLLPSRNTALRSVLMSGPAIP